jgi:hypothetical protein
MEERKMSIKSYIDEKIRMLMEDFSFHLTDEEIAHLESLKSESDVDRYAWDIINKKL